MIPGVTFHSRASWQNPKQPVTGPNVTPHTVDTYAMHYTAANNIPDNLAGYLRNLQTSYLNGRGYSLGYNFAVDQNGGVWEIRGFDIRSAANLGWNNRTIAILCLVDGQDPMTIAAVQSANAIYAEANRRFRPLTLKAHRDIGATACPGIGINAQIRAGVIRPQDRPTVQPIIPPHPTEQDDDMTNLCSLWKHTNHPSVFLLAPGGIEVVDGQWMQRLQQAGVPLITSTDDAFYALFARRAGIAS